MRSKPNPEPIDIGPTLEHLGAVGIPTGFGWLRLRCPFHDDRTSSASVNHGTGGFKCHSCDISGDAVKLLVEQGQLSHREAFKLARELAGMDSRPIGKREPKRRASDILRRGYD